MFSISKFKKLILNLNENNKIRKLITKYIFSSDQKLLIRLKLAAIRLCSLRNKVCITVRPGCSLLRSSPALKHGCRG